MTGSEVLALVASMALVTFAAVLAIAETTITHLGKARARALDEEVRAARRRSEPDDRPDGAEGGEVGGPQDDEPAKRRRVRWADRTNGGAQPVDGPIAALVARRDEVLPPVLLLALVCHLGVATMVAVFAFGRWGATGAWVGFVATTVLLFVLAEVIPKTYALQHTARAATRIAPVVTAIALFPPVRLVTRLLVGVSNVILPGKGRPAGPTVSEEELLALAGAAAEDHVIDPEEQALIRSIIEFGDTVAREVMVPRTDMVTVEAGFRVEDAIEVAILNGFSRLPATGDGGPDDIIGIVYAKDLMRAERDGRGERPVAELARPAHFVPESKRVPELLREMQAERFHLAIVVDEHGATVGIASLEDLIEELVGEIHDEYDLEEPLVEPLLGGGVRVNARMDVDDLAEMLEVELPDGEWDSVGGLVVTRLGRVPKPGEEVQVGGLTFKAERVSGQRIGSVCVARSPQDVVVGGADGEGGRGADATEPGARGS